MSFLNATRRFPPKKMPPLPASIKPYIKKILLKWLDDQENFSVSSKIRDEIELLGIEVQEEHVWGEPKVSYPLFIDDFKDRAEQLLKLPVKK